MIQYYHVVFAIIIVILFMFLVAKSDICKNMTEQFDTYWNHDMGANTVYNTNWDKDSLADKDNVTLKPMAETSLETKYNWSKTDPLGLNIYDKQYENDVYDKYKTDNEYLRDVGLYDTRFTVANTGYGFLENRASISSSGSDSDSGQSPLAFMTNTNPVATFFRGEKIVLSQKTFDENGF